MIKEDILKALKKLSPSQRKTLRDEWNTGTNIVSLKVENLKDGVTYSHVAVEYEDGTKHYGDISKRGKILSSTTC